MLDSTTAGREGWESLPLFLTVEQAAQVLQIGRSKAYELTVEWEHTQSTGLPCVRFGSQKRVPREVLIQIARTLLSRGEG